MRAARDGRVFAAGARHFFSRSGPRILEMLEILTEILHPGRFALVHQGTGWIRL